MGDLNKLRQKRGIYKSLLTKMETWIDESAHEAPLAELEVKLRQLHKYEVQFDVVQDEIENSEDGDINGEERTEFEERLGRIEAKILEYKGEHVHQTTVNESAGGANITLDLSTSELPKLELPKFSGEYLDFPHFYDTFINMVHNCKGRGMSDLRRFALLKSCLEGRALDAIRNLPMNSANYQTAMDILTQRFMKKRLIFESNIKKLWELPKASSTKTLRELCDDYTSLTAGLKLVATEAQYAHGLLIQLLLTKCDRETIKKWEEISADKDALPAVGDFMLFLNKRCTQLESVEYALQSPASTSQKPFEKISIQRSRRSNTAATSELRCPSCKSAHELDQCAKLQKLSPEQRYQTVKDLNRCIRCLILPRSHNGCRARCDICKKTHHTMLHFNRDTNTEFSSPAPEPNSSASSLLSASTVKLNATNVETVVSRTTPDPSADLYTFLATANVKVRTSDGNYVVLRALLDGGSQLGLITDRARKLLGLETVATKTEINLKGINNTSIVLRKRVVIQLKSLYSDFEDSVMLMVHPQMRQCHPTQRISVTDWSIPNEVKLADPNFNIPHNVDLILNAYQANWYLLPGQLSLGVGRPLIRETRLGWVVVGDVICNKTYHTLSCSCIPEPADPSQSEPTLSHTLKQFWELEDTKISIVQSSIENEAETHFKTTYKRLDSGRFMVRLPFYRSPELLGESRGIAVRRLATIEKKCMSNSEYGRQYTEFIDEYLALEHCEEIVPPSAHDYHYYIPHFAVSNENSTTTQTRVVFDASCATESGVSLNELLMVGPKIQRELVAHLLTFRCNKIALTGDISKMYRQIDIAPEDRNYQCVVWRKPGTTHTQTLQLKTVTYGTASAPFQAVRCMQELADLEKERFPIGSKVLKENFYVDDMLTGGDSVETVLEIYTQIKKLLDQAQMSIRKFQSNSQIVLKQIPKEEQGSFLQIGKNDVIKTLGLNWLPDVDKFTYYYKASDSDQNTKRSVLSEISRLFDPLGLLQPVIVRAKIFMQVLWTEKLGWDTPLSERLQKSWERFRNELKCCDQILVPRYVIEIDKPVVLEMHGFCDASEVAYAACMYIRAKLTTQTSVNLLIAKSRVAPLKRVSLPRLELCGALLLSELYASVIKTLNLPVCRTVLWTDSTIALRWVTDSPHKWTSFVATRATKIQASTTNCEWRHVPTDENPADIASRGAHVNEVAKLKLWFNGPAFLYGTEAYWPKSPEPHTDMPEIKKQNIVLLSSYEPDIILKCKIVSFIPLIKFSVWPILTRSFGYVHRFITRMKQKWRSTHNITSNSANVQPLEVDEIHGGTILILKIVQRSGFPDDIAALTDKNRVKNCSPLKSLNPVLDSNGLMRVGGRLRNAPELSFDEKHPVLLPRHHPITRLLFLYYHYHNLHVGPTALLALIRQKYWPVKGKIIANQIVRNCFTCSRAKPVTFQQIMGDLPKDRVAQVKRPFLVLAVDFAGPFTVHQRFRGSRTFKAYLAIFVCFSTKAVHLELVEQLTADAFLNCLNRFVHRRGAPHQIWSDNATNFVGANRKLQEFQEFYYNSITMTKITDWCRDERGIKWNFIPANSPHFNGLVEASVKSAKYHLSRVVGLSTLTFQELNTVIIMVEGMLNSRPLIPLSCSPDDQPITPAHFLVNGPLYTIPEPEVSESDKNSVDKWKQVMFIKQVFWRKWSQEYLKTLQQRYKWKDDQPNPCVNDLVLLVDKDQAPLKWRVGKISCAHPGRDGKVRVVEIETSTGKYRRAITEICPVPQQKI